MRRNSGVKDVGEVRCGLIRKTVRIICVLLCFSLASPVISPQGVAFAKSKKEKEKEEERERAKKKAEKEERERQEERERAKKKAEKEERERQEERERARKKAEEEAREAKAGAQAHVVIKAQEAADADCNSEAAQSWNDTLMCRSREKVAEAFAKGSVYDAAIISQKVYGDVAEYTNVNHWALLSLQDGDSGRFTKADGRDNRTGFHAIALRKGGTIMVAFEGTNLFELGDLSSDLDHFFGMEPEQYEQAEKFVTTIVENFPNHDIILTGHSLGGSLAEHLAVKRQKWDSPTFVITFNSAGLNKVEANLIPSAGLDASNVWNYYTTDQLSKTDTVYSYGTKHFGTGHQLKVNVPLWEGLNNGIPWKIYRHSIDTIVPACEKQCP